MDRCFSVSFSFSLTLFSFYVLAGQNGSRNAQEKRNSAEEMEMDFQDAQSIRYGRITVPCDNI